MDSLSGLYQLLDARVSTFPRLCRLQGRLDLLLSQALPSAEAASGMGEGGMLGLTTPLVTVTVGGIQLCVHVTFCGGRSRAFPVQFVLTRMEKEG